MRRSDGTRLVVAVSLLLACVAVALFAVWWVLAGLGDGCAWIFGLGGCR
jgi:hypothetical protein